MKQEKKAYDIIFILTVMVLLLIPSLGMIFYPTTVSYENRELKELPVVFTPDGSFNRGFFDEVSDYAADHIALRNEISALYAVANAGIFSVSARDSVILGEDGWLYYTASSDDYLHKDLISGRELFNIAHNMALMQEYCRLLGKEAVFIIAPNKNSLYGEHMPKAYKDAKLRFDNEYSDMERLMPYLSAEGVNHIDLEELLRARDETLYYKTDSHWNNKGALIVYRELMEKAGVRAPDFSQEAPGVSVDFTGDLNKMLYGMAAKPEERLEYIKDRTYFYYKDGEAINIEDSEMVENNEVETVNPYGSGNLLMYRDSFANSLIPYLSQTFSYAFYSKIVPYNLTDLVTKAPDYVIIEKAERHLPTFAEVPPIMSAPLRMIETEPLEAELLSENTDIKNDGVYYNISGWLKDTDIVSEDSGIYICPGEWAGQAYEAFLVSGKAGDYGFSCYIPVSSGLPEDTDFSVIVENNGVYYINSLPCRFTE
ncbi:MAG: hypothetical protein K5770_13325 [Lachnospiraceae bacterium]|nr:hypothetical protein [Lachnospiraceae bacterium]